MDWWLPRRRGGRGKHCAFGVYRMDKLYGLYIIHNTYRYIKLVYIGWINSKVLLYSPGDYIQYPVINSSGKQWICMYN